MIETADEQGRLRWSRMTRIAGLTTLAIVVVSVAGWVVQNSGQAAEQARIAEVLELAAGTVVADVGAGAGDWTVDIARRVGADGHVYSTEIDPDRLRDIREAVSEAGLGNVTVIEGAEADSNLPEQCCDAILLRRVYHHFTEPGAMTRSMFRSLRPGGFVAVIDFEPGSRSLQRPEGVPEDRGGHGMPTDLLRQEMAGAGFEFVRRVEDWPGGERDFCLLFRRPSS